MVNFGFIIEFGGFLLAHRFLFSILNGHSSFEFSIAFGSCIFLALSDKLWSFLGGLLPFIIPYITILYSSSACPSACPTTFHRLILMESINERFSSIISSTSWLLFALSSQSSSHVSSNTSPVILVPFFQFNLWPKFHTHIILCSRHMFWWVFSWCKSLIGCTFLLKAAFISLMPFWFLGDPLGFCFLDTGIL